MYLQKQNDTIYLC